MWMCAQLRPTGGQATTLKSNALSRGVVSTTLVNSGVGWVEEEVNGQFAREIWGFPVLGGRGLLDGGRGCACLLRNAETLVARRWQSKVVGIAHESFCPSLKIFLRSPLVGDRSQCTSPAARSRSIHPTFGPPKASFLLERGVCVLRSNWPAPRSDNLAEDVRLFDYILRSSGAVLAERAQPRASVHT